jgi:protein-disulfide isomerase
MTFIGMLGMAVALSACDRDRDNPPPNNGVSEYTAILAGIDAMRREMHEMRGDIAALKQDIDKLRTQPPPAQAAAPAAPPVPRVSELQLDNDDPAIGSKDAGLAIVEFTDYECPFCTRFDQQTLPRLKASYIDTGKVRLITRDMPLVFHSNAAGAALAANCAAEQNGYQAMRTGLFSNTQSLGQALFRKLATDNKLDVAALETCMQDPARADEIRKDARYAASLGVTGTPTFFIGRVKGDKVVDVKSLVGALPFESFATVIDSMLSGT